VTPEISETLEINPEIVVPELSLVVLIGASGSGKSTLARRLFERTEILSSDTFRGWVSNDENNQEATGDAFEVLHYLARKRLARGLLTVIDATNVRAEDRQPLVQLAREFHCLPVAIIVDTPEKVCHDRNATRPDRDFGPHVVRNQRRAVQRELRGLFREGFRHVFTLRTPEECSNATLVRQRLWNDLKHEHGPFDIIGDVHGCYDELIELLQKLNWRITPIPGEPEGTSDVQPPLQDGIPRKRISVTVGMLPVSMTCGSLRFTCSPAKAMSISIATTHGICRPSRV
jgi:protein phosphatase